MTNDEAIYTLKNTAWLGWSEQAEKVSEAVRMAVEALKAQLTEKDTTSDCISRQWLMECVNEGWIKFDTEKDENRFIHLVRDIAPSVQPEPLSDAYMKAVWTWLLDYQIKAAELKGRYTPYEVLSWVANDWRKEHERSDRKTGGD
jgi:hypothetical protein